MASSRRGRGRRRIHRRHRDARGEAGCRCGSEWQLSWIGGVPGLLSAGDGGEGVIRPGEAQNMSAGSGAQHSEMNPFDEEAHVVQMWVAPDEPGGAPRPPQAASLLVRRPLLRR